MLPLERPAGYGQQVRSRRCETGTAGDGVLGRGLDDCRWASYEQTGLVRKEMKLESCLGMAFSAGVAGVLVVSGPGSRQYYYGLATQSG